MDGAKQCDDVREGVAVRMSTAFRRIVESKIEIVLSVRLAAVGPNGSTTKWLLVQLAGEIESVKRGR